ncbi:MAG: hypothetical protein ACR2MN_00650 [Acidimicrobiales bacterium]
MEKDDGWTGPLFEDPKSATSDMVRTRPITSGRSPVSTPATRSGRWR